MAKVKKARPRIGRPPIADAEHRSKHVRVLTTEAEHTELQRAAADASMSVSTWIRSVALERARALAAKKEAARDRDE